MRFFFIQTISSCFDIQAETVELEDGILVFKTNGTVVAMFMPSATVAWADRSALVEATTPGK